MYFAALWCYKCITQRKHFLCLCLAISYAMHVQVVVEEGKPWPDVLNALCSNISRSTMGINGQRCPGFLNCRKMYIKVFFFFFFLTLLLDSETYNSGLFVSRKTK